MSIFQKLKNKESFFKWLIVASPPFEAWSKTTKI
jgi:hypothetical protein